MNANLPHVYQRHTIKNNQYTRLQPKYINSQVELLSTVHSDT